MALVIDDHLLLDLLIDDEQSWVALQAAEQAIYTSFSWYYRLSLAANQGTGRGSLSSRLAELPDAARFAARAQIDELPESITMLTPRELVPVMGALAPPRRLNFLSAEALALAVVCDAEVAVRTDSPPLRVACAALDVGYRVVDAH